MMAASDEEEKEAQRQMVAAAAAAATAATQPSVFYVTAHGQIESGEFPHYDELYLRYRLSYGADWNVVDGVENGVSQIARKMAGPDRRVVWNFPLDVSFKSTNAFGWPRLSVSVYGLDFLGRDVVRGYGSLLVPPFSGETVLETRVYVPVATSAWQRLVAWISGTYAEFYDSNFVAKDFNRDLARVEPTGCVKVRLRVETTGMDALGYYPKRQN